MPRDNTIDNWTYTLGAFGAVTVANAGWMLAAPEHWYFNLPAAVPDFGPFNQHFVRDIGAAFFTIGVMLLWAAVRPAVRVPALVAATLFNGAHTVVHLYETATGYVGHEHWAIDVPGVYAPTVILAVLTVMAARRQRRAA